MWGWILVEVCDANRACTPALFALEAEFPGVTVMETACLSLCEQCAQGPYVLVNGEPITADTPEALLAQVRTVITQLVSAQP
ncbi:MAG: YuzB family protein [Alicyclobacillus sp.]|nr:YuzB family protein [Alicyclobacillus sp.]